MKSIFFITFALLCSFSFSQNKNKLSFEFGYGINSFSMRDINQYYIDSFALRFDLLENKIKKGYNGFASIKFQPGNIFDIGIYGNYQFAQTIGNPTYIETDNSGQLIATHKGEFVLKTEAIGIGLTNSWYISHLLNFQEKKSVFLQRFRIATEVNAGIGFSKVTSDIQYPTLQQGTFYDFFTSTDFQGQIALKFEYDYLLNPIVGTVGFKMGYQYFKTKTVKDRYNQEWVVLSQYPINLDFSSFFGSIYLSIGK